MKSLRELIDESLMNEEEVSAEVKKTINEIENLMKTRDVQKLEELIYKVLHDLTKMGYSGKDNIKHIFDVRDMLFGTKGLLHILKKL